MRKEKDERLFVQRRLYTYHFLNDGITFVLPTLMASFYIVFNLNWFQMGLIFAVNSLVMVILQIIIGYYTDKKKTKILMEVGLFLLALSTFLMIFSFDFISLLLFALLSGIALSFQHSISYATTSRMFGDNGDNSNRDIMIGRQGAAGDVGKCLAVFTSTLLVILFMFWQIVLIIWSLITFAALIIIVYNFRNIRFEDYYHFIDEINENDSKNNFDNKNIKILSILVISMYVLVAVGFTLLIINLATYLRVEKTGLVSEYSGFILGYTLIFGIIGAYFSGFLKKTYGMSNSLITISLILIVILFFYLSLDTSNLAANLIFYALIGFFLFLMYPQLLAAVSDCFHTKKVGFGYGIILSIGWFGNFIGSLIGGYFADIYTADVFFIISIFCLLFIIIIAVILKIKEKAYQKVLENF